VLDWEGQIEEICERLGIDPEVYNSDDKTKEIIAKLLGFPSFACFAALPEASAIIDGRGTPLLEGHKMQQMPLATSCVAQIKQNYLTSRDELELEREVNRFIKYLEENFDDECAVVGLLTLHTEMLDICSVNQFSSLNKDTLKILEKI